MTILHRAVLVAGKGTNKKTTLYVGGLEENVNEATLHSAFIPFGDIKDVNIPMDNTTGKHRGFGFVEYESAEVRLISLLVPPHILACPVLDNMEGCVCTLRAVSRHVCAPLAE